MLTPASVHYSSHEQVLEQRSIVLTEAYMQHPERFVRGIPDVKQVPENVWINKPEQKILGQVLAVNTEIIFPTFTGKLFPILLCKRLLI